MHSLLRSAAVALGLWGASVKGIDVTWTDDNSVKSAASTIAYGMMKYYTGNNTGDVPGNLPDPYFWWEAGAMFGTLIDYWWLTGDTTYNAVVQQGMIHQAGPHKDFMPTNQTRTEGNDDQGFWAMAAMSAAELKFPDPPKEDDMSWLASVQAVFNEYVTRWDTGHCDGGMRWQIFQFNAGFDYKNSISNGCFFNVAARLARYTGNETYAEWALKVWDWERETKLVNDDYQVFDGSHFASGKCDDIDKTQWTYNAGIFLHGAAVMYNHTEKPEWKQAVDSLLKESQRMFVKNEIIYESLCEEYKLCDNDQQSFKGYYTRWLAHTTKMSPWTSETIKPMIAKAGERAVKVCAGPTDGVKFKGIDGTACGFTWLTDTYDGLVGVGSQMNALDAVMYTRVEQAPAPVTQDTGGTSKSDPNAGNSDSNTVKKIEPITMGDRVGAGVLTALMLSGLIGGSAFVVY